MNSFWQDTKSIALPGFLSTLKSTVMILLVVGVSCGFFMGTGKVLTEVLKLFY